MLDPSPPRELDQSILKNVDLIKPNAREAEFLTGIESEDRASARSATHPTLRMLFVIRRRKFVSQTRFIRFGNELSK